MLGVTTRVIHSVLPLVPFRGRGGLFPTLELIHVVALVTVFGFCARLIPSRVKEASSFFTVFHVTKKMEPLMLVTHCLTKYYPIILHHHTTAFASKTMESTKILITIPPFVPRRKPRQRLLGAMQPQFEDDLVVTQSSSLELLLLFDKKKQQQESEARRVVPKHKRQRRSPRIVRFADESTNQVYENTFMTAEECRGLWYHGTELLTFRQEYTDLLFTLRHLDMEAPQNPNAWAGCLCRAYHAFCTHRQAGPLLTALSQIPVPVFLLSALGTERVALRSIVVDTLARRHEMYALVRIIGTDDADLLSHACRNLSRPSRLFARHVAEMAAGRTVLKADMI